MASPFDELGGEPVLRPIVDRFVDRVFDDIMIGFFFAKADRKRIKEKEYELIAEELGAPVRYTGRPLDRAHRAHQIFDGQFSRRLTILRELLDELEVPASVRDRWLEHTLSLRHLVVSGPCQPDDRGAAG